MSSTETAAGERDFAAEFEELAAEDDTLDARRAQLVKEFKDFAGLSNKKAKEAAIETAVKEKNGEELPDHAQALPSVIENAASDSSDEGSDAGAVEEGSPIADEAGASDTPASPDSGAETGPETSFAETEGAPSASDLSSSGASTSGASETETSEEGAPATENPVPGEVSTSADAPISSGVGGFGAATETSADATGVDMSTPPPTGAPADADAGNTGTGGGTVSPQDVAPGTQPAPGFTGPGGAPLSGAVPQTTFNAPVPSTEGEFNHEEAQHIPGESSEDRDARETARRIASDLKHMIENGNFRVEGILSNVSSTGFDVITGAGSPFAVSMAQALLAAGKEGALVEIELRVRS